jgi:hypothetical protein
MATNVVAEPPLDRADLRAESGERAAQAWVDANPGARTHSHLVTKGEILELQNRAAAERHARDLKNAERTPAGANGRRDNPQCIIQFRLCGNHSYYLISRRRRRRSSGRR